MAIAFFRNNYILIFEENHMERIMRDYFITTSRLGFSTWRDEDLADAMLLWGDPDVARYISAGGKFSEDQIRLRLRREIENQKTSGMQYWPIFLLQTGEFAGCCGLRPYDAGKNMLELGVHLRREHWGKGLASEACRAAMEYAFGLLGALALFAGHNPNNAASAKMLAGLGFRFTHDEYYEPTGLMHPSYLLTIADWEAAGHPSRTPRGAFPTVF